MQKSVAQPDGDPQGGSRRRDSAYERLLFAIIYGDLVPGSAVDEKTLAEDHKLGLAAVRDALYRLSLEGLVERQPRIGTRIGTLGIRELREVFEARVMLEGGVAELAAERANATAIAAMRQALEGFEQVVEARDFRRLVRMDRAFHQSLASATHNAMLLRQVTLIHNDAARFWYFGLPRLDPASVCADIASHMEVVDAIERRDPAAAKRAMRAVLGHFPDNVREFLAGPILFQDRRLEADD
ncbi:MAG: GntR family transcriptional regulator [Sneathiellaceae bacterium]